MVIQARRKSQHIGRTSKLWSGSKKVALGVAIAAAAGCFVGRVDAAWIGATSGTATNDSAHSYLTNANWDSAAPENTFSPTLTGNAQYYFSANWNTGGDWTITPTGNFTLLLTGGGTVDATGGVVTAAARTITLGGNLIVNHGGTSNNTVTLGGSGNAALNIALGGSDRSFSVATGDTLTVTNVISGANQLEKIGDGLLVLSGANSFSGGLKITAGTVRVTNDITASGAQQAGDGTITLNGGSLLILSSSAKTISRNIAVTADGSTLGVSAGTNSEVRVTSVIANGATKGGLTLEGSSRQLFINQAANTFGDVGKTVKISNSVYVIADGSLGDAGNSILLSGGNLTFAATGTPTFSTSRAISLASGAGTLNVTNNGTLNLNGTLTGSNTLSLNSQTANASGQTFGAAGSGSLVVLNGDASGFSGGVTVSNGTFRLGSSITLPSAFGLLTLANTAGVTFDMNNKIVTLGGLATGGATGGTIINAPATLTLTAASGTPSFAGVIADTYRSSGTLALIKDGAFGQTLTASNTYTGGTTINAGTLTLGHATNTLADTGTINVNGGTLAIGNNSDTVGAVTLTSGSITGGSGTLTGSSYDVRSGTISARLGGSAALTKNTGGTVTLSNSNNSYAGGTTVNAGVLAISTTGGVGTIGTGTLTMAGGTFAIATNDTGSNYANTLAITGSASFGTSGLNALVTFSGANQSISGTPTITVGGASTSRGVIFTTNAMQLFSNASFTGSGNSPRLDLTGGFDLKDGNRTLTFDGTITATVGGSLSDSVGANRTLTLAGSGTVTINTMAAFNNGAGLVIDGITARPSAVGVLPDAITLNSGSLDIQAAGLTVAGLNGSGGTVINPSGSDRTLTLNGSGTYTFDGDISPATGSRVRLVKDGNGTQILTSANSTYVGTTGSSTTINAGVLEVKFLANGGSNSSIGAAGATASNLIFGAPGATLKFSGTTNQSTNRGFTLSSGVGGGATLDASGSGSITYTAGTAIAYGTADQTRILTLTGTSTASNEFGKVLANNGAGLTSLTKSGTGTWILSGTNTYDGTTDVNQGKLFINGSNSGAVGAVTVASTATLGGSGTIGGAVTIQSGGTFAPGTSPGTLTLGSDLTINGTHEWEFDNAGAIGTAGTNYDLTSMTNAAANLTIASGTLQVKLISGDYTGSFWNNPQSWKIINVANTTNTNASFASITSTVALGGQGVWSTSLGTGGDAGDVFLNWSPLGASANFAIAPDSPVTLATLKGANSVSSTLTVTETGGFNGSTTVSGLSGPLSLSDTNLSINANLTGTSNAILATSSYGTGLQQVDITNDVPSDSVTVNYNVGEATAAITTFNIANALSGVANGSALSSRTTRNATGAIDTNDILGSEAVLEGVNSGETISMNWRTRTNAEVPPSGDLAPLFSNVVQITTTDQADLYVVKIFYRDADLTGPESALLLGELVGGTWVNAGLDSQTKQGAWVSQMTLGNWGIDTTYALDGYSGYVWAVVQGDGTFAVIPEPTSLALLGLGAMGLLARRRR